MRFVRGLVAVGALAVCGAGCSAAQQFDVVIRDGHVIDGTGSPWYGGDVAIKDGRIVRIAPAGTIAAGEAKRTIDAHGMVVAPGFIDMLGQSERAVLREPHVPSKIFQGITTEITGEGNSIAPRNDRMLAVAAAAAPEGQPVLEFRSFTEYFARLETQGAAINLGSYMGATTARRMVLGDEDRAPTAAELATMQELVRQAMRQGAMGLSTALMYSPAPYAKTDELIALAKASSELGGIYATHMRSEADGVFAALDETFRIAREAKIPVEIFHLKVAGKPNWGEMPEVVRRIDAARAEGLDIEANTYAYTVSGNPFSAFIPPWAHDGGDAAMVARLKDPATRARVKDSILHDRTWDNEWFMISGPEGIFISTVQDPALQPLVGKTVADVAAMRHEDPVDCILELLADDPKIAVLLSTMQEADVAYGLKQPWMSVGLDAGGATPVPGKSGGHPRAYGTFPRILRKYVREDGLLTLPDAIRKFSALPAGAMHLADRGVLKAGMWADVVVFDPAKVSDLATFESPSQLAVGMEYVLVNGVPVISEGKMTEALPGKVLRGAGYVP
jgi:dihydroorotase/N-acyl-D-amino-acid deacylase